MKNEAITLFQRNCYRKQFENRRGLPAGLRLTRVGTEGARHGLPPVVECHEKSVRLFSASG